MNCLGTVLESDSSIDFLGGREWVRQPHTASAAAEKRPTRESWPTSIFDLRLSMNKCRPEDNVVELLKRLNMSLEARGRVQQVVTIQKPCRVTSPQNVS